MTAATGVSLDVADEFGAPPPQHHAFPVSDDEFDPLHHRPREIDVVGSPRASHWNDPNRRNLDVLTRSSHGARRR